MERVCAACQRPIAEGEDWFRLREDYVHLACAEKYTRQLSERRREEKAQPPEMPDRGVSGVNYFFGGDAEKTR